LILDVINDHRYSSSNKTTTNVVIVNSNCISLVRKTVNKGIESEEIIKEFDVSDLKDEYKMTCDCKKDFEKLMKELKI
tara:strand:+ start:456 stop:689 length:234 start_codon:yes stop_codon:yes gene_type:complete